MLSVGMNTKLATEKKQRTRTTELCHECENHDDIDTVVYGNSPVGNRLGQYLAASAHTVTNFTRKISVVHLAALPFTASIAT